MKKQLKTIGLVLVILGAATWLYFTLRPDRIESRPYARLGAGAADATAKLLNNSGNVVLVNAEFGKYKLLAPTTEAQIKAFTKAIGKAGLKIAAIEKVAIAPPSMSRNGIFMQPGQMAGLIARHPDADAIVLFVGLAGPKDLAGVASKNGKPKLILVSNAESSYKTLLQTEAIHLAIVPRPNADDDANQPSESAQQWFERHYMVVTPGSLTN